MAIYRLTRRARRSLAEIWSYIAQDNEDAADKVVDQLIGGFQSLGQNPWLGRSRDDLRRGCRTFVVGRYVIVYRVEEDRVSILDAIHGKRDVAGLIDR